MTTGAEWLERIRALPLPPSIKVMNVCGGHDRSITSAGLRKAIMMKWIKPNERIVLVSTGSGLKSIPTLEPPRFPTVTHSAQLRA